VKNANFALTVKYVVVKVIKLFKRKVSFEIKGIELE